METFLFDLDDTIIDSSIYHRIRHELLQQIMTELKISEIELQQEITKLKAETGKIDTYDLCKKLNCIETYYTVLEKYLRHTYSLKTPSIPSIFKKIKTQNKRIGIISNSQERTIRLVLDRFNLSNYVNFIQFGNKLTVYFWINLEKKHLLTKTDSLVIDNSDEILSLAERAGYNILKVSDIDKIEQFIS